MQVLDIRAKMEWTYAHGPAMTLISSLVAHFGLPTISPSVTRIVAGDADGMEAGEVWRVCAYVIVFPCSSYSDRFFSNSDLS